MQNVLNIEEIKKYNSLLKTHRDNASALKAQIDYYTKELETLCSELTSELGIEVTKDNVESIYNEQVEKINSTLNSGKAVLSKIESNRSVTNEFDNNQFNQPQINIQPQVNLQQQVNSVQDTFGEFPPLFKMN